MQRRRGFCLSEMPPLTQNLGPWVAPSSAQPTKSFSREAQILGELCAQIPPLDRFAQNWHPSRTNWLPFYWAGYSQTTRYTYRLEAFADESLQWKHLRDKARTEIRKAQGRFGLVEDQHASIETFLNLNDMVFRRQGLAAPYSESLVRRIFEHGSSRGDVTLHIINDAEGVAHAGAVVLYDSTSAYYLLGGSDPSQRNSGAMTLCLWLAILKAGQRVKIFDFEGSMMPNLEPFVRSFGATQTPYFRIQRTSSRTLRAITMLRGSLER